MARMTGRWAAKFDIEMDKNPESPWNPRESTQITPTEFELQVQQWLRGSATNLGDLAVVHQGKVESAGGSEYAIDVLATFSAFEGAQFTVLIECKHQKRPVERDEVLILEAKRADVAAQKAMLFSTAGFQSGALEYATAHQIATITVVPGKWLYETKGAGPAGEPPPWIPIKKWAGIRVTQTERGVSCHTLDADRLDALTEWLRSAIDPGNQQLG